MRALLLYILADALATDAGISFADAYSIWECAFMMVSE